MQATLVEVDEKMDGGWRRDRDETKAKARGTDANASPHRLQKTWRMFDTKQRETVVGRR